jgi:hypothetical protein
MTSFSLLFPQGLKLSDIFMIPDIESVDERRGFEEFETMLSEMLFAALFAYILSYLSRLQNAYMHCPRAMSLWDFVRDDVFTGFFSGSNFGPFTIQTSCKNALPLDFPDILVIVCPLLVVLVIIFLVIWTLRSAADAAKKQLQIYIKNGGANLIADKPVEEIKGSLEQMQIWPMRYPKFNMLLCLCGFAVISVVFYKIGLVILGVVMWVVIKRIVSEMNR